MSSWTIESPYARSLLAGAVAGTTVDLSLFPLDTLKTRLQAGPTSFIAAGGFSGIYRGVGSAIIGSAPSAALFFITYDSVKRYLAPTAVDTTSSSTATATHHMLAATFGEIAACAVRVPTEVIKQRAQASQYRSSRAALRAVLHDSAGLGALMQALYRGGGVTLMREVPFTVIQFPLWEGLKRWHVSRGRDDAHQGRIGAVPSAVYGSGAGAVAALVTTPLDVLKTRLMLAKERESAVDMLRKVVQESGWKGLFAGVGPRTMWISIGGAIFLGSYQWADNAMSSGTIGENTMIKR